MTRRNRLAGEASPYLLQHATNPVDWWPWNDEALAESKRRDVPILLSIGYSACHWCHVMERESFEDESIAALMNEHFVNIKVDREERPDLDQIYQLVVQLMGRGGGWPLTVFLTPDQRPFFAGTYFPPDDRHGMPGLPKVLRALSEAYRERREAVDGQAAELTHAIASLQSEAATITAPAPDLLAKASQKLLARFDRVRGGFGRAPKFPNTMPLEVLMRAGASAVDRDAEAASAVRLQLESMQRGGIWDHLGGGFHRYSTDERWLVPHFEKMLYDNALLLRAYLDGLRAFAEPSFGETARRLAAYVERELTDPDGGYYASQDADSDGEEGKFFVWDEADVKAALRGEPDDRVAAAVIRHFDITPTGNFEDHGRPTFKTVLSSRASPDPDVRRAMSAMFEAREQRVKPFRDEKVLTSWCSLMIGAMAEAGMVLDVEPLLRSAERAFGWLVANLVTTGPHARALRLGTKVHGQLIVKGPGFLDDHAYLANAAIDLYEATGDPAKIALAGRLVEGMLEAFWTEDRGFYFAPRDGEALIVRSKDAFDNAVPSGASMACRALLRLGSLVEPRFAVIAEAELGRLSAEAIENPIGYGQTICELDRVVRGSVDVVLVGTRADPRTRALARTVYSVFLPTRTLAWLDPSDPASFAACTVLGEAKPAASSPVAYVCRGRTCSLPVTTPESLRPLLAPARSG
jgi:uncharacterized protein YyaL (SSP411 family)